MAGGSGVRRKNSCARGGFDPKSDLAFLKSVDAAIAERAPIVVATRLADGNRQIFEATAATQPEIAEALRRGRSALDATGETFLHAITPARRVVIVGATHIAQHLASMAAASGYDVKVIDPRTAFTSPARFEPSQIVGGWPEDGLAKLAADPFTAIVTLTHVDEIDDEALTLALKSPCRYIGSLGSRKTHAKRVGRLKPPVSPMPISRASTRRSASTSPPKRRARSRPRSWPRSSRRFAKPLRRDRRCDHSGGRTLDAF